MPKYIKHYLQYKNIYSHKEKKQRARSLQNYLDTKSKSKISFASLKARCVLNGRSKAYYSYFKLSRHSLKKIFSNGQIPGVTLSSW